MLTQPYQRRQGKGRLSQCFQFVLQYHIIISCSPGSILALVHSWEYTPWHTRTQSWMQRISAINMYNSITPETLLCRISRYTKHRVFVWCRKRGSLKPLQMWASSPSTQLRLCLFVRDSCANRVHLQHGNKRMNVSCCSQEHFRSVVGDHYICYTGFLWARIFSPKPSVINTWIAPILLFCSLSLHLYIIILIVYSVFGLF